MPLAGLILNRTHPLLCSLPVERAIDGIESLKSDAESDSASLATAVLQIHADRGQTAKREIRLLSRFTGANPNVPVVGVPSLPFDVSDLEALRALADQITAVGDDAARAAGR
jgi:anion-transporting  ArsA/GET3 family ATPase